MADEKQKMTSSYKAAFVFSIVMTVLMFVLYSAEYQTTHKASSTAIPFLLWCYQTWLIYKQQNAKLVGFYKAMLWIGGIALAILSLMLASNTDIAIYGFDAPKLIGIAVMLGIYYGMLQFFKQQLVNPSVTSTTSNIHIPSNDEITKPNNIGLLTIIAFLVIAVAFLIFTKFNANNIEEQKISANANRNEEAKVKEPCYVYWDGMEIKLGKAKNKDEFNSYRFDRYGVEMLNVALPNATVKALEIKKDNVDMYSGKFGDFIKTNWSKISTVCQMPLN